MIRFMILGVIATLALSGAGQILAAPAFPPGDAGEKGSFQPVHKAGSLPEAAAFALSHPLPPGFETPLGYEISRAHNEELKIAVTPPNVTLGGMTDAGTSALSAPATGASFDATTQNGWIPYDAAIAVGPTQIVVCTNEQIEVYDKNPPHARLKAYNTTNSFFPTDAGGSFDCKAFYDAQAGRFVLLFDQESNPQAFMNVAVSLTSDATQDAGWYKYHLDWTLDNGVKTTNWGDFPSLGYNDNLIVIGANQYSFSNQYQYSKVRVLQKSDLYAGVASPAYKDFVDLRNSDNTSAFTVKAGRMLSANAAAYLLNTRPGGGSSVTLWRIDGTTVSGAALARVATVTVGNYAVPPNGRQPHGGSIADGDCRTQDVVMQNGVVYTAFSEKYGNRKKAQGAGCRYLEVTTSGVMQKDVSYFASSTDRYYPAVTVDPAGNVSMVYSQSGSNEYASMYSTGINKGIGETGFETGILLRSGAGAVTSGRWGDYNAVANDFSNGSAVWLFAGWAQSGGSWGTHVTSVSFGTQAPFLAGAGRPGEPASAPKAVALTGNYPNPFNPTTVISFALPAEMHARIAVFNLLGQQVALLLDGLQSAGDHTVTFDAATLPSGVYFSRLEAGGIQRVQRMLLAR